MKMLPLNLDVSTNSGKQDISLGPVARAKGWAVAPQIAEKHRVVAPPMLGPLLFPDARLVPQPDFILYTTSCTESTVQRGAEKQLDCSSLVRSDQCD
jgi:hypothetical protein